MGPQIRLDYENNAEIILLIFQRRYVATPHPMFSYSLNENMLRPLNNFFSYFSTKICCDLSL